MFQHRELFVLVLDLADNAVKASARLQSTKLLFKKPVSTSASSSSRGSASSSSSVVKKEYEEKSKNVNEDMDEKEDEKVAEQQLQDFLNHFYLGLTKSLHANLRYFFLFIHFIFVLFLFVCYWNLVCFSLFFFCFCLFLLLKIFGVQRGKWKHFVFVIPDRKAAQDWCTKTLAFKPSLALSFYPGGLLELFAKYHCIHNQARRFGVVELFLGSQTAHASMASKSWGIQLFVLFNEEQVETHKQTNKYKQK